MNPIQKEDQSKLKQEDDWRIQLIPYEDKKTRDLLSKLRVIVVIAVLAIFVSVVLISGSAIPTLGICVSAVFLILGVFWLDLKILKKGWKTVRAHCVDRECQYGKAGGEGWTCRIKCDYHYNGVKYTVTPLVGYLGTDCGFASEKAALKFLDKRISPTGECKLLINPQEPLQTQLIKNDRRSQGDSLVQVR